MIKYQLVCSNDHTFDAWFRDSAAYDTQADAGAVLCPMCGTAEVRKALMAPNLRRKGAEAVAPPPAEVPAETPAVAAPPTPAPPPALPDKPAVVAAMMGQALRQLRTLVEQNCENVGTRFAEEARKIHHGEVEARGIYGETTPEEAAALEEEGVDVHTLPWVRNDG